MKLRKRFLITIPTSDKPKHILIKAVFSKLVSFNIFITAESMTLVRTIHVFSEHSSTPIEKARLVRTIVCILATKMTT